MARKPLCATSWPAVYCHIEPITAYDTDRFGTFTRDIARAGSQLEAARAKAKTGMQFSGLPIGLASEGAFGPHPVTFLLPHNLELLLWLDERLGIEVVATAFGSSNFACKTVSDWDEAIDAGTEARKSKYRGRRSENRQYIMHSHAGAWERVSSRRPPVPRRAPEGLGGSARQGRGRDAARFRRARTALPKTPLKPFAAQDQSGIGVAFTLDTFFWPKIAPAFSAFATSL